MTEIVRIVRVLEYVGERKAIEDLLKKAVYGTKAFEYKGTPVEIRAATIGTFADLLDNPPPLVGLPDEQG